MDSSAALSKQQQLHRGEVVVHGQSENGVHHFVTVDKCFLKMQNMREQCINETKGFNRFIQGNDGPTFREASL